MQIENDTMFNCTLHFFFFAPIKWTSGFGKTSMSGSNVGYNSVTSKAGTKQKRQRQAFKKKSNKKSW